MKTSAREERGFILVSGGRDALCAQIVQDLLHFRGAEARRKCDLLKPRGKLRLISKTSPDCGGCSSSHALTGDSPKSSRP